MRRGSGAGGLGLGRLGSTLSTAGLHPPDRTRRDAEGQATTRKASPPDDVLGLLVPRLRQICFSPRGAVGDLTSDGWWTNNFNMPSCTKACFRHSPAPPISMLPTRREGLRQPREIKKLHANIEIGGAGRWAVHGCLSTCDLFSSCRVCIDVEIICPSTVALRVTTLMYTHVGLQLRLGQPTYLDISQHTRT